VAGNDSGSVPESQHLTQSGDVASAPSGNWGAAT
jgi:hypothetical protein